MIIANQKPIPEVRQLISRFNKLLVVGCQECVTVCFAGGAKEVSVMSAALRMAERVDGNEKEFVEFTSVRQCEPEYVKELADKIGGVDAVLSLACGVGVQTIAEHFPAVHVLPALNTTSFGRNTEPGVWVETCAGCGNCILAETGGICPIARCSKSLLNGPCGGSQKGRCEIAEDVPCAWAQIYERMSRLEMLATMEQIAPPKDWRTSLHGGPRTRVREDQQL
jgi:ferredoxin